MTRCEHSEQLIHYSKVFREFLYLFLTVNMVAHEQLIEREIFRFPKKGVKENTTYRIQPVETMIMSSYSE
jgi:hypothetical protein